MDNLTSEGASRKFCVNCGKENPRKILKDGSLSNFVRLYCSRSCKDNFIKKRARKTNTARFKEARRRQWEATKADPERLEKARRQSRKGNSKARQWLIDYKMEKGCADCGYKGHYSALQLDHEGFKSIAIADARTSIQKLQQEIRDGQCVVRCANCHSIVTWKRKVGLM